MSVYDSIFDYGTTTPNRTTTTPSSTTTTNTTTTRTITSGSGSTGARAYAHAREETAPSEMSEYEMAMRWLASYYRDNFERRIPSSVEIEVSELLRAGMERELIEAAIDEAMAAPRPSWAYARAVLARCWRDGIRTVEAFRRGKRWF